MDQVYYLAVLGTILAFPAGYAGWPMPVLLALIIVEFATRKLRWVPTVLDRPLLALLIISLVSGIVSVWRWPSVGTAILFALMALVSIYPAARVIRARPQAIRPIVGAWVVGAVFAASWGIIRTPSTWPSGASTPALLGTGMGTSMAAAIVLVLGAWTVWDRRWIRIGLAVGLPVLVTALQLSTSRASWIAASVGAAVMIALAPRRRKELVVLCVAAVIVATMATTAERQFLLERLESISSLEANADRLALWTGALRMVRDHPLLGTGYGTFVFAWPLYRTDPTLVEKPTAHNLFLNFAAETGLLGLAAFLFFLRAGFAGLWNRIRSSRGDPQIDGLWVALFAATVAILTQQLFDATVMSWHVGYGFLALFALAGARPEEDYRSTPA